MSPKVAIPAEPIAGYTLTEQIGVGGYGEVWKADAPGGLTKAVKLVYGRLHDQWATCELRSLRRIKEVRHPFLLSLERIEVVDGQLVIVTELADGSLKDRYEECRRSGLPGIPRDELLRYLSDAAEALDYMRERYSLQHLDVKPENLLVVGGRVKVGDFGLVRDIMDPRWNLAEHADPPGGDDSTERHSVAAPVLAGLTPLYASPELFDGQPSVHSDQYSLAIVHQELLTGVPPYPGETAEQLASQHRTGHPRLAPLPEADRPIIARALAKDPGERFASCRDMIAGLRGRTHAATYGQSSEAEPSLPLFQRHADTLVGGSYDIPTESGNTLPRAVTVGPIDEPAAIDVGMLPQSALITDLPPFEIVGQDGLRPTLWLGIGGTAAPILRHLRRRLHSRFGNLSRLPALQMLLVDTDREAISRAVQGDASQALEACETLVTPLRKSQEYRERSDEYLRWLSRRWLYNIPFSGRTEGLRPLGRLAFVDHAGEIARKLRDVLKSMTDPESLAATSKAAGLEFRCHTPRVFLIASISGGTGSGMVFDMGHAVRRALEHLGLPAGCLCGLLTHSTSRAPERKTLAIADAYAWLREWKYWLGTGPDAAGGSPAVGEGHAPPLPQAYLVHLGDEVTEQEFERAADDVAAYLYLDVATAGGEFFDKCRQTSADHGPQAAGSRLRTFGVCQASPSHDATTTRAADLMRQQLLSRCGHDASAEGGPQTAGRGRKHEPMGHRLQALSDARVTRDVLSLDPNGEQDQSSIAACLAAATPRLLACGGAKRMLLAIPGESTNPQTRQRLAEQFGGAPTIIAHPAGETIICCEAEQLDVDRVAAMLVGQRRDCARMALRLHTRIDVAWTGRHAGY